MANALTMSPQSLLSPMPATTMKDHNDGTKELGSPRTTSTSGSSSYDERILDTPPPMHGRLGRIIISSGSSPTSSIGTTTTSNSVHIETGCHDGSPVNPQLHRGIRRLVNHSQLQHVSKLSSSPETDKKYNASDVLLRALNQLNRLATLDSTEYQQRLLENSLPALQTETRNSLYCPSLSKGNTSTQIGLLSQPIQTPLVQLSMSIHRLHAVVANVTRDIDGHTDEVQEQQSQLEALRRRNHQLESAANRVHRKNLKLKKQSRHDRKVAKGLQHKVHKYEAQLESQGFQLMASKIQQHEIQLQLTKSQKDDDVGSSSINSNDKEKRERLDSDMSDFFDIEEEIEGVAIVSVRSNLSETTTDNNRKEIDDCTVDVSFSDTSSKMNSIFDDTSPTLRFSAEGIVATCRSSNSSCKDRSSSKSIRHSPITHEASDQNLFPSPDSADSCNDRSTGDIKTSTTQNKSTSLSNRFAKFLGYRPVSNYNLKMVPPCNMQFVELNVKSSCQENKEENQQSQMAGTIDVVEDHGIVQTNDTSSRSLDGNRSSSSRQKQTAFAICGFDGFNAEINMKPTLGARLSKINGQAIDEDWTLEKLYSELAGSSLSNSSEKKRSKPKPIVLTFRNEIWDKAQCEDLNTAIRQGVSKVAAATSTHIAGGKEEHGGLLNIESGYESDDSDREQMNEHFQRARTASAESVGKAMNGFGNFLQNFSQLEGGY